MNLEYTFCRYFNAERLLLRFSVEGQVSRSDERYLLLQKTEQNLQNIPLDTELNRLKFGIQYFS